MKRFPFVLLLLGIALYFSCQETNSDSGKTVATTPLPSSTNNKKTQVILKTQAFGFDPTDKNKITGDYIAQKQLTLPTNLVAQSKWILFEGPVLENDLVAYRYYADSRHRFDIFGKTVSALVMDTVSWKYHDIMDWGSDILKVGNSLGMGSPAIYDGDSLYTFSDCREKKLEILQNEENIAAIRTLFIGLKIKGQEFDLIQDWSIRPGQSWSEIHLKVINGNLPEGMYFATGIVKHLPAIKIGETAEYFYAMNWGKQSFHQENMGMAISAPKAYQLKTIADELNHAFIFENAKNEVRYRIISAWERDNNGVKEEEAFKLLVERSGR